jgi:hypothetical protein
MKMIQTISQRQFIDAFHNMNRSANFSYASLCALYDYFEHIDENMELDVIAICCEYEEDTYANIANSYNIDISECENNEEKMEAVIDYLNDHTTVIYTDDYIVTFASF